MLKQLMGIYQESQIGVDKTGKLLPRSAIFNERWFAAATLMAWQRAGTQGIGGVLPPVTQQPLNTRFYASVTVRPPVGHKQPRYPDVGDPPQLFSLHGLAGNLTLDRAGQKVELARGFGLVALVEAVLQPSGQGMQHPDGAFWHRVLWLIDLLLQANYQGGAHIGIYVFHPRSLQLSPNYSRQNVERQLAAWEGRWGWPVRIALRGAPPLPTTQDIFAQIQIIPRTWDDLVAAVADPDFTEYYRQWELHGTSDGA
jgi:hypothetical protein